MPGISGMPPPPPPPEALAKQRFMSACELLKSDKMRTFRVDIETDSTIEPDKQAAKEAVVEMFTAIGGFLEKSLPIGQAMPELAPALGQSILFAFRTFGAGRDVEGIWEDAIDKMTTAAKNPPPKPPSPEEIKAQSEQQRMQAEMAQMQAQAQIDQQKGQQDLQLSQAKNDMEIQKMQAELQIKREELNLRREELGMRQQEMQMEAGLAAHRASLETAQTVRDAALAEEEHGRATEQAERGHELNMETMEFKAKQAQKPQPGAGS